MQAAEFYPIFIEPLERTGCDYMVTGSIAAIVYGEPRLTHDIDVVIQLDSDAIIRFHQEFSREEYYVPPLEVIRIEAKREHNGHFNLIHVSSGLKADCYPYSGDSLHVWGFKHKRRIKIGNGYALWMAPPEYVIVRKLQYFREGGSQKHLSDIANILDVCGGTIDGSFLQSKLVEMGLKKEWDEVIEK